MLKVPIMLIPHPDVLNPNPQTHFQDIQAIPVFQVRRPGLTLMVLVGVLWVVEGGVATKSLQLRQCLSSCLLKLVQLMKLANMPLQELG